MDSSSLPAAGGALGIGCGSSAPPSANVTNPTSHRPWPLPQTSWVLSMRWHDLLFLHWPIRPELLRPLIPEKLDLDIFDGYCWIGVVPFRMSGVRPRYVPIPFAFPELNVRTYVKRRGRTGVWFFSLDAASWIAVRAARWFGLPYYDARMTVHGDADVVHYQSARFQRGLSPAVFSASYRPTGAIYQAEPGTLDHWLTERYCLYSARHRDRIVYGEIHHAPWPLQPAEVELSENTMAEPIGIVLPDTKPLAHFARNQEVVAWPIVALDTSQNILP